MKTYEVGLVFSADMSITVEADNAQDAADMAYDSDACHVGLCHYCASKVNVDDVAGIVVYEEGEEVYNDTLLASQMKRADTLQKQLDFLLTKVGYNESGLYTPHGWVPDREETIKYINEEINK